MSEQNPDHKWPGPGLLHEGKGHQTGVEGSGADLHHELLKVDDVGVLQESLEGKISQGVWGQDGGELGQVLGLGTGGPVE